MACVKEIGRPRILASAIVSGMYPLSLGAEDMLFMGRAGLFLAAWLTWLMALLLELTWGRAARKDPAAFEKLVRREAELRPESDRECIREEGYEPEKVSSIYGWVEK